MDCLATCIQTLYKSKCNLTVWLAQFNTPLIHDENVPNDRRYACRNAVKRVRNECLLKCNHADCSRNDVAIRKWTYGKAEKVKYLNVTLPKQEKRYYLSELTILLA